VHTERQSATAVCPCGVCSSKRSAVAS